MSVLILAYMDGTGLVQLLGASYTDGAATFGQQVAYQFKSDGTIQRIDSHGPDPVLDPWYISGSTPGIGSSYQLSYTVNSGPGSNVGGLNAGQWYTIGANLTLGIEWDSGGGHLGDFQVQIRDVATETVKATGNYFLELAAAP